MTALRDVEKAQGQMDIRLLGLEYAIEESVPTLVGALVVHLARKGLLDLAELENDLHSDLIADPRLRDSTDALFTTLAGLVSCYRRDGTDTARYSPIYEKAG